MFGLDHGLGRAGLVEASLRTTYEAIPPYVTDWKVQMLIEKQDGTEIPSSEITPYKDYLNRRQFIGAAAGITAAATLMPRAVHGAAQEQEFVSELGEKANSFKDITTYNNFYEFGTAKEQPREMANMGTFHPRPWTVRVEGEVANPGDYHLEDLMALTQEDRVYRLRCVEAWSMVVPWRGFQLSELLNKVQPNGNAQYVEFVTLFDPEQMPGQRAPVLQWPYVEGLRLDEAMHPLTLIATGIYGQDLLNQNGAPLRLVVPWKYGFKSIKSIVTIRLTSERPRNTWQVTNPSEYGFFANVNPEVSHPRWSQARVRRIGSLFRRDTLMFNGYADQVQSLYAGMDLARNY